jgi:hypothetical protein
VTAASLLSPILTSSFQQVQAAAFSSKRRQRKEVAARRQHAWRCGGSVEARPRRRHAEAAQAARRSYCRRRGPTTGDVLLPPAMAPELPGTRLLFYFVLRT